MHKKQRVADMAVEILRREAGARTERTGETVEAALKAVLETEAGQQLQELRDGTHADERADQWQEGLAPKRAKERSRARREGSNRVLEEAAWHRFAQEEMQELEMRKDGQFAGVLDRMRGATPVALPAALRHLASQDRKQAEEGLVALMSGGKVTYKHLDDFAQEDRPARIAANRSRTPWLKEQKDGWLARMEERL